MPGLTKTDVSLIIYIFFDQTEIFFFYFPSSILLIIPLKGHSWLWAKHKIHMFGKTKTNLSFDSNGIIRAGVSLLK